MKTTSGYVIGIAVLVGIGIGVYAGRRQQPAQHTFLAAADTGTSKVPMPTIDNFNAFIDKFVPSVRQHFAAMASGDATLEFKVLRTDLKKTESLINPVVGEAVCQLVSDVRSDVYSSTTVDAWTLTFAYESGKWRIVKGVAKTTDAFSFPLSEQPSQIGKESEINVSAYLANICNQVQDPSFRMRAR